MFRTLLRVATRPPHYHEPMVLHWSDVSDAVVVFREERSAVRRN